MRHGLKSVRHGLIKPAAGIAQAGLVERASDPAPLRFGGASSSQTAAIEDAKAFLILDFRFWISKINRAGCARPVRRDDRKSTRLNSSHGYISYAVFCL